MYGGETLVNPLFSTGRCNLIAIIGNRLTEVFVDDVYSDYWLHTASKQRALYYILYFYNIISDWTNYIRYYFISELFNGLQFKFNK